MLSQDPHTPGTPREAADESSLQQDEPENGGSGWRWWFSALGPWFEMAVTLAAIVTHR